MRFRSRMATGSAVMAIAGLVLVGCSSVSATSGGSAASSAPTLTIGSTVAPQSWDPAYVGDANYVPYAQAAYDSLIRRTEQNTYVPMLATSWQVSNAGKTVTLDLRKGVTFSDGTPFNAAAVKANVEHFAQSAGPLGNELTGLTAAKVINPYEIELDFKAAIPDIIFNLSDAAGRMASPKAIGTPSLKTVPDGTGPYVLSTAQTIQGSTYTLTARKDYWDKPLQKFGAVVFKIFPTETGLLNALKTGQVDAGNLTQQDNIANAQAAGIQILHPKYHISWIGLIFMDRTGKQVPALGSTDVRLAISHAVNSAEIMKVSLSHQQGTLDSQIFNEASPAYSNSLTGAYSYNPALAKQLMARGGYAHGFTVTMPATPGFLTPAVQTALQQELAAINIKVNWVNEPIGSLYGDLAAGKFPMSFVVFGSVPTDWSVVQSYIAPNGAWNPDKTTAPQLEKLISDIPGASQAQQNADFTAINKYVVDNAWFDPWFWANENFAVNKTVKVVLEPLQNVPFIYNYSPAS